MKFMIAASSRKFACLTLMLLLGAMSVMESFAQGRGNGGRPEGGDSSIEVGIDIGISIGEARELAIEHGLTGRQGLPPGIARNLGRGKPLPPGIAKQVVPGGMLAGLPHIDGHEWVMIGRDLVLVAIGTAVVVAILDEVFN